MNVNKISLFNNRNSYLVTACRNNSEKPIANQNQHIPMSYENKSAAQAITLFNSYGINFSGHVENIMIWKPSDSEKKYNAKLEQQEHYRTGNSADNAALEAIRHSKTYTTDARIEGHVENSDVDYLGPQKKSVYFADPNERMYNGLKSSYDYVVYAPGAYDDDDDSDYRDSYDTVSDWESYGWIDEIGPSWL